MMTRPTDHCVVRWCDKRQKTMIWLPYQTVQPNRCPVLIIDDVSKNFTHYEFLGILAYNSTRPGNTFEECWAVHRGVQASKGWRINAEMEHAIKYGRPISAGFPTEQEKQDELSETSQTNPS